MQQRHITLLSLVCLVTVLGCDKLMPAPKANKKAGQIAPTQMVVKGTIIAKVNNSPITLEELTEEITSYNNMLTDRPEAKITTRDQKIKYLKDEMVKRLLLYQDGLAKGLDRNEDVIKALEKTRMDLLVMQLVQQETQKIDVPSKEIEDYYNNYKDQLKEPEERQAREIMVSTEQEAKDILIALLQGGDFAALAKERSRAASSSNGGDLGFISPGKKFPQFDTIVFSGTLDVGQTSSVVKGPEGSYILKLEAKRGGAQKTLSEMWDDIKRGLTFLKQQQKIEELIGKLSRDSKIEIYESEIK